MNPTLPVSFVLAPLPFNFTGTPQELADAIVARLSIENESQYAVFSIQNSIPSSNIGPVLLNGVSWYVWDSGTASYQPLVLTSQSQGYHIGSVAPNPSLYRFWIETDGAGAPLAIKIYNAGSWTAVP
jgi:hypothetical protein